MIIDVNGNKINSNLMIFDSVSLQLWSAEDGKMVINTPADSIKEIKVELKNE